jgi:hypothetical protein
MAALRHTQMSLQERRSNPTDWRSICRKDMNVRLTSSIFNARLIRVLMKHGIETQYGAQPGQGCHDGLFVLQSVLETRRYHNKETWALFVDLVNAYDTINHKLLFALLEQYVVPPRLAKAIQQLYTSVNVTLQIGKEKRFVSYTVGIQQGNNMAPILFLFVMQA